MTSCSRPSPPSPICRGVASLSGTLDRDRDFVDLLQRRVNEAGIGNRISFAGPLIGADLDRAYAAADVLVVASRGETYGMVVTEALARGLPVIATDVGGLPHTLGRTADGRRPGLLVAPGDAPALAAALSSWLRDAELRRNTSPGRTGASRDVVRLAHDCRAGRAHTHRSRVVNAVAPRVVTVSPDWLALREPADAAARATDLVAQVRHLLPARHPIVVHDLGCGTGSMARWLAPQLPAPQHWVMYDRDADLLARAAVDAPPLTATDRGSPSRRGNATSRALASAT